MAALVSPHAAVAREHSPRFALLIGNRLYTRASNPDGTLTDTTSKGTLPNLKNPCNDVRKVGDSLVAKAHWKPEDVKAYCDVDSGTMSSLIDAFIDRFMKAESPTAILYFAGHGAEVGGRAYAFGVNAAPDIPATADLYRLNATARLFVTDAQDLSSRIKDVGKVLEGGALLVVMDACRDNPLIPALKKKGIVDVAGPSSLPTLMGVEAAFSTSEGFPASDGTSVLSPYADAFVRHIADGGTMNDVLDAIATDVYRQTDDGTHPQQPNRSGHFVTPPYHCFPECNPSPAVFSPAATAISSPRPSAAPSGARTPPKQAIAVPSGSAAAVSRGFGEAPPLEQRRSEENKPLSSLGVEIFYCTGDGQANARATKAKTLEKRLREAIRDIPVVAMSNIDHIRVRELTPQANSRPDLSIAADALEFDPVDPRARQWAAVVQNAAPDHLLEKAPLTPVADYLSIYLCKGAKVASGQRRVFVQIAAHEQEFVARRLISGFPSVAWDLVVAEDIELRKVSPDRSSIRYYAPGDEPTAQALAEDFSHQTGYKIDINQFTATPTPRPGLIELWFGKQVDGLALQANIYRCGAMKCPAMIADIVGADVSAEQLAQRAGRDWPLQTGDYANTRFSKLEQINTHNVGSLKVAWTFSTGVLRGHEGSPLVIGDTMYVHTPFPNIIYALDLNKDGRILWRYTPKQDPTVISMMCCDTVSGGLAYDAGKLFFQQADTNVVALDAATGQELWKVRNGDPKKGETNTATVLPVNGKIIVGLSGGEFGVRCHVTAYDETTGRRVWRAYSEGPDDQILVDPEKTTSLGRPVGRDSSLKSWSGDDWQVGGGCTWGLYSYDPKSNLFYYGSGNPASWNAKQRPGANRWTDTIWARDPDTGVAKWVYQMTPHDEWGYAGVNEMPLVNQKVIGKETPMLVHFDRNGFGYTLNRETGALLLAQKFDPAVNWSSRVTLDKSSPNFGRPEIVAKYSVESNGEDDPSKGVCPASLGSKSEQPSAFSPKTGLFYVPTNHVCMDYQPFKVSYTPGQPYVGATLSMYPAPGDAKMGALIAWDATAGKRIWSDPESFAVQSGILATAGDVVFYGTLDGYLKAVDAKTGKELYRFKTPSGVIGSVMTYEHNSKQYVAVYSGVGGWAGIGLAAGLTDSKNGLGAVGGYASQETYTVLGGTLTVFALPD